MCFDIMAAIIYCKRIFLQQKNYSDIIPTLCFLEQHFVFSPKVWTFNQNIGSLHTMFALYVSVEKSYHTLWDI